MKLSPRARQVALAVALAATLAATFSVEDPPADAGQKSHRRRPAGVDASEPEAAVATHPASPAMAPQSAAGAADSPRATLSPPSIAAAAPAEDEATDAPRAEAPPPVDPFRGKSWLPPPPPPPKPTAPPLPFQYLGHDVVDGDSRYFLARRDKYLTARIGDTLESQYRLEKAEGSRLVFVYQPLKERQFLAITPD